MPKQRISLYAFSSRKTLPDADAYYAGFGSFNDALRRAKLPLRYNQEFDKEKLIGELRGLHAKLKLPLLGKDVSAARSRGDVSSLYHLQKAFGSVPLAVAAAYAGRKKYTRDEMIRILQ